MLQWLLLSALIRERLSWAIFMNLIRFHLEAYCRFLSLFLFSSLVLPLVSRCEFIPKTILQFSSAQDWWAGFISRGMEMLRRKCSLKCFGLIVGNGKARGKLSSELPKVNKGEKRTELEKLELGASGLLEYFTLNEGGKFGEKFCHSFSGMGFIIWSNNNKKLHPVLVLLRVDHWD